jgi:hypothetical protein
VTAVCRRVWADSSRWASLARRRVIESMARALMRLTDRDSHKAALAAGGLLVAAPAATWSVLAVVHSSMAWRQTLLRGTSRVGVALPRANPQPTPAGRDRQIAHLVEGGQLGEA